MKKIVIPLDFEQASLNAFVYALEFARAMKAQVVTVGAYRVRHPVYNEDKMFPDTAELAEFENYQEGLHELHAIIKKYNLTEVQVSHRLESGPEAQAILNAAREENADLIVMGSSKHAGWMPYTHSHTQDLVEGGEIPLLAIPEGYRYRTIKKILFLTRFGKRHYGSLKKLQSIASLFHARVDVVELTSEKVGGPSAILSRWRREFEGADIHFHILDIEPSAANVKKIIADTEMELITLEAHPYRKPLPFLKTLARELVAGCPVPLLCLPTP